MTTSIMVEGFIKQAYQVVSDEKDTNCIRKKVNELFDAFVIKANKFRNKDDLIREAETYKAAIISSL